VTAPRDEELSLGRLVDHLMGERRVGPAGLAGLLGLHVPAVEAMIGSPDVVPAQEAERICRALEVAPPGEDGSRAA
jgi:hypothetical protein